MGWTSLTPALPESITTAGQGVSTGLAAARTAMEAAKLQIRVATALANDEATGVLASANGALNAALSAVESSVNEILDDGGGYVLLVPLPKKGLAALLEDVPVIGPSAPTGALSRGVPASVRGSPLWRHAFQNDALFTGGNAHFLKTVAEAIYDSGDDSRPRFGPDSYWAYAVLIAGATDVAAGLTLASYLDRLFGSHQGSNTLSASRGHGDYAVSGLRASPSGRGGLASLEWDVPTSRPVDDGEWSLVPVEYAIIRSERPQAMTARRVLDLFPSRQLTEGMTGLHEAKVLKIGRCDGFSHRYVDTSPLVSNQTYYYHVAIKTRMDGPDRRDELGYDLLSSAARYRPEPRRTATRHGTPPDWYRSPSIARMVPAVDRILDQVVEVSRTLVTGTTRVTSLTAAAITALDAEIAALTTISNDLSLSLQQLEQVFAVPAAGVHINLRTGRGNAASVLADLCQTLGDTTDPERPKFDSGDEYVTGAILLLTGPSPDAFARAWAMLQALFDPASEDDLVLKGINSIQAGIETAAAVVASIPPSVTFNNDMTPRSPGQGDASCE